MSVISRKFSACPVRTAAQTWDTIVNVIADTTDTKNELIRITGIASSIISDATPKDNPITIIGSGPRLRIYCLYEEDGSTEDANEASLNWKLFEGDWQIYLPVEKADFDWINKALQEKGKQFKAYEAGTKLLVEEEKERQCASSAQLTLNLDKLKFNG